MLQPFEESGHLSACIKETSEYSLPALSFYLTSLSLSLDVPNRSPVDANPLSLSLSVCIFIGHAQLHEIRYKYYKYVDMHVTRMVLLFP